MIGPARPDRRAVLAGLAGAALAAASPGTALAAGSPPEEPLVVDPAARGRRLGRAGGDLVTLVAKPRDIRYISAYSYTRLVGYDDALALRPDLLARFDNDGDRVYTFVLRRGHRWSDGAPFTAEDVRYWWEDVANSRDLSPSGPPEFMMVDGQAPRFEVVDPLTVRFAWDKPNPRFLPELASPRDPFIYRPAHYLKRFHARHAPKAELDAAVKQQKVKGWAALHNRLDAMFEQTNPDLPTLQPWRVTNTAPAARFVFVRNPHYHRVDSAGQQLPYIDRVLMDVAAGGLLAAKANAGEADLLFRGLTMEDIPILREGERAHRYRTHLWPTARGSELALYPNLTTADPVWRALNRDLRYRRALSLAIDRRTLNNAMLFGLGTEGNDTVVEASPLYRPEYRTLHAGYDPDAASRLLDEIGLTRRNGAGIRLLPDGRELEIIVETDGESNMLTDGLTLVAEFWREVGIKLFIKPQDRTILRNRSYAGATVMVAAQGLDLAMPTAEMPPDELAPIHQDTYSWPKWGQHAETHGREGQPCDMPEAHALLDLNARWMATGDAAEQAGIWAEMLRNRAENQWVIGTVSGALQPVVAKRRLLNVPEKATYSWKPTAMIGLSRMDEYFWGEAPKEASVPARPTQEASRPTQEAAR
ncbi:ABC transporter substrate-binding protein [uncultured Methylobacterium sp.]|jgi:peptide/nickel transport system substrate-binding protein|uniref:ABC transporter substrate-binding protein n=1 Tax=uncultured Methylobacterium sp. TaxID=157278 RepID=UPI00261863E9|nr:ABC transporter substrate-binding protein [uncultured Methylobacterium sp.]